MASKCINKSTLVGFVGQPPEVRYLPTGGAVTTVRVATSDSWRDKETGETKEHTEWHSVVVFGKLAEFLGEHLQKGAQVYVEGSLRTRNWTDQSGQVKYTTEIIVNNGGSFIILGKRHDSATAPASQPQQPPAPQTDYPDVPDNIPF